ncbi:hypothetical protein M3Y99_00377900 [Aphelenchoides fujianensis]|nr:hypothetical protein M3Y99_00377900 [Aphelenchoides fujianensis]
MSTAPFERDVAALKATILKEAKAGKPFCEQCGVDCGTETGRQRHAELHKTETNGAQAQDEQTANQFVCSVCGVHLKNHTLRNRHEKDKHRVKRTGAEVRLKEAVALTLDQLREVVNVGFGLLRVQRGVPAFDAELTAPISVCFEKCP